jgi:hypothetical protein
MVTGLKKHMYECLNGNVSKKCMKTVIPIKKFKKCIKGGRLRETSALQHSWHFTMKLLLQLTHLTKSKNPPNPVILPRI